MFLLYLMWLFGAAFLFKEAKEISSSEETKMAYYLLSPIYVVIYGAYSCLKLLGKIIKKFIEL